MEKLNFCDLGAVGRTVGHSLTLAQKRIRMVKGEQSMHVAHLPVLIHLEHDGAIQ